VLDAAREQPRCCACRDATAGPHGCPGHACDVAATSLLVSLQSVVNTRSSIGAKSVTISLQGALLALELEGLDP
jgi:hypothetical protein